jgi:HAE1 family hydrophobic/amphiphilic exporter-1
VKEAVQALRVPATISVNFQGTVKEFQQSFQGLSILLIVAILVIYIVLGILYESFIHPITILSDCLRRYSARCSRCGCSTRNWTSTPSSA